MLGALTNGRRHGREAPGMGGMIGTCMTATFQFSRHMLRIAAVARLKGPLTAPDDRQLAQPKKGHCCCDRDSLYHLYGG